MRQFSLVQKLAFLYALLFVGVVVFGYLPGVKDEQGKVLGLFDIDPVDDGLHLVSGAWAAVAGWMSVRAATNFFKWFGTFYALDGVVGMIVGKNFLNLHIFGDQPAFVGFATRLGINLPHLVIGGLAVIIGFVVAKRLENSNSE